jgi:hypothetical protein
LKINSFKSPYSNDRFGGELGQCDGHDSGDYRFRNMFFQRYIIKGLRRSVCLGCDFKPLVGDRNIKVKVR